MTERPARYSCEFKYVLFLTLWFRVNCQIISDVLTGITRLIVIQASQIISNVLTGITRLIVILVSGS